MRQRWMLLGFACLGCAATTPPLTPMLAPPAPPVHVMALPAVTADTPRPLGDDEGQVITHANGRAVMRPTAEDFVNAEVVFPYRRSMIYQIETCLHEPTDLILPPGERLLKYVSGDKRWVKDVSEGLDPVHVLIMPTRAGLRTRITLITNKARYYLLVRSGTTPGLVAVTWQHPEPRQEALTGLYGIGYGLSSTEPLWAPQYVWDYRGQTFLLFDPRVPATMPPSVTVKSGEQVGYVNYGPVFGGRVYVIDRLLSTGERLELHVATQPDHTIQIARIPETRLIECPGAAECRVVQPWTRMRDGLR
jgi:hypothetical protein